MIIWGIIWVITAIVVTLLSLMEVINGSYEWRFWLIIALIFFLTLSMVFMISAYKHSVQFCEDFKAVERTAHSLTTQNQEMTYLPQVINYNHYLQIYQAKAKSFGIFSPYCKELLELQDIQLQYFDMDMYKWE